MSHVLARLPLVGREWTVREADAATLEHELHGGRDCPKGGEGCVEAFTCRDSRTIWLCDDLDDEAALSALLHEWAHVELPNARHRRIYRIEGELHALVLACGWGKRKRRRSRRP